MKWFQGALILFLLFSYSAFSQVSDCENVDLRSGFGPVNDQQDIGWCYAYTAADLVSYKYAVVLNGKLISPFHIALLSNANDGNHFRAQGGSTKMAMDLALAPRVQNNSIFNKGICFQGVDKKIIEENGKVTIKDFYKQLDTLFKLYQEAEIKKDLISKEAFNTFYEQLKIAESPIANMGEGKLLEILKSSNVRDFGIHFLDLFCAEEDRFVAPRNDYAVSLRMGGVKVIIPKYGPSIQTPIDSPDILIKEIKKLLDQKKIPVGIGIYSRFLKENNMNPGGDQHAAIVVGKEKINNSCHFIVRNSWGDCPGKESTYKYSKNITKCEKGYLWIKESILSKNLDSIEYIK